LVGVYHSLYNVTCIFNRFGGKRGNDGINESHLFPFTL